MAKIVTFGEIMLRLQPEGYLRLLQANKLQATFAGAEANVAVSLANFGEDALFVTKLPDNPIGQAAANSLRMFGVNTDEIIRGGERLGIFFLEKGASQRPSLVIYDRNYSSIQKADKNDFNWAKIFEDANWFHFTGITPALSDSLAEICLDACKEAKKRNIYISCDLNYRNKLWSREKACEVMSRLCKYVDLCVANEEDAADVFGIASDGSDVNSGKLCEEGYKEVAKKLFDKFGFKYTAISLRTSINANNNKWAGLLYDGSNYFLSRRYDINIVDRVGGGDSFSAGLIYSLLNNYEPKDAIEFAVAASCLKHSIEGDFNHTTVDEVLALIKKGGAGRVKR